MRIPTVATSLALTLATALTAPAQAAPSSRAPALSEGLVVKVSGCHRDVERHFVPEFDRRAWHVHRGSNCRPVRVDQPDPDPVVPRDCHRDARRHYLPEYGDSVWHRHVGDSCRIRIIRRSDSAGPGACIRVGPVTVCD